MDWGCPALPQIQRMVTLLPDLLRGTGSSFKNRYLLSGSRSSLLLSNREVCYRFYKIPPLDRVVRQLNPVRPLHIVFHFNIMSRLGLPSDLSLLVLRPKFDIHFLFPSCTLHVHPSHPYSRLFDLPKNI